MVTEIIKENDLILMEAAVIERLRRADNVKLHTALLNAPLIYDSYGKAALTSIYNSYIDVAQNCNIPMFLCTPTWRANHERVMDSGINPAINIDAVKYLNELRDSRKDFSNKIKIGGLIACKNDCYLPDEGLSVDESEEFHAWQIEQLVRGGVDFLLAETLPNVAEAVGIARAMEKSEKPYFISFVISREGKVLDGSSLVEAIKRVDHGTSHNPIGFMVNCAHPSFLVPDQQPPEVFSRLIGFNANASSLDHCDLDGTQDLMVDSASDWGDQMLILNRKYGVKILGGCCGTGVEHLNYITSFYR